MAWGVAIFIGLVYASQHWPVSSSPHLERLSVATFLVGLAYLALVGWRHVDRGWKLRRPEIRVARPWILEPAAHVLIALSAGAIFFLGNPIDVPEEFKCPHCKKLTKKR